MQEEIVEKIVNERKRQKDLPGSEFDLNNGPNDWIAITSRYLSEGAQRKGIVPESENFSDNLTKAAAIILAALEHVEHMKSQKRLK